MGRGSIRTTISHWDSDSGSLIPGLMICIFNSGGLIKGLIRLIRRLKALISRSRAITRRSTSLAYFSIRLKGIFNILIFYAAPPSFKSVCYLMIVSSYSIAVEQNSIKKNVIGG